MSLRLEEEAEGARVRIAKTGRRLSTNWTAFCRPLRFRIDAPRYVDLYLQGRLMLDELVSARISLDQVNDGFKAMHGGEVARSVIVF